MQKLMILAAALTILITPLSAEKSVEQILSEFNKTFSIPSIQGTFTIKLISKNGDVREIKARAYQKIVSKKQNNRLFIFDFPPRVRGTGLLVHSYSDERENNMWIYLPTVKRVKRISLESSGGGYFMGSDFTYSDLIDANLNNMKFEQLESKTTNGIDNYVIKSWGKNEEIIQELGYGHIISYYNKETSVMHRRDFYDLNNKLLKIYKVEDYFISGPYHYPTKMTMTNVQTEHKSVIEVTETSTKEIPDRYFTTRYLSDN
ncbi:MAG: outer membrane lipoprotein-sorting protein [Spirochaetes bacterium]|jgi:outer membrane lipoprotein-sorting protein|nr:outer membrane lipoprotein-sorting protein [Spirochaetota bacterium]